MSGGDQTGPLGTGPMTGKGAGFCAGFNAPGYANPMPRGGFGGGFGQGRAFLGGGRGWRRMFRATGLPGWMRFGLGGTQPVPDAKEVLRNQAQYLENQLQQVKERLSQLGEHKDD